MDKFVLIVAYVMAALLGLCVGSFLNVVIYRVPRKMSLASPPSHCTTCDYVLRWYDNIPVLSYIFLRGRCRGCGQRISPRYMAVEIANALLWTLSVFVFFESSIPYAVISALAASIFICIFFIDIEEMLIFDRFVILVGALGICAAFFDGFTDWQDHLIGGAVGLAFFLLLYYGSLAVLKREGIGFGDVKLVCAGGILLGWQRLVLAILVASVAGSIVLSLLKAIRKDGRGKEYPFAPFIVVGFAFAMFFGADLIDWYVGLIMG